MKKLSAILLAFTIFVGLGLNVSAGSVDIGVSDAQTIINQTADIALAEGNMIKLTNSNLPFTYSGLSTYYFPCPDQSFLPVGTMDYIDGEPFVINDGSTSYTFIKTRSGKRFQTKDVETLSTRDMGNNDIKSVLCKQSGTYLSFDFDMNWNIPFNITAEGITYRKNSYQDFYITSYNAERVVITFDYTVNVESFDLPENGLFNSYHWEKTMTPAGDGYKLVLTLKNKNSYTGYVASYSDEGKLNIKFNAPLSVQAVENDYGGTLQGTVIALSAGHGGWDGGAIATHNGVAYSEYDLNKGIVQKLKAELEKAGATVVICDAVSNNKPDYRARSNQATAAGAGLHIAIHQNSAGSTATGFETWYYSPHSYQAANYLLDAMESFYKTELYPSSYNKLMRRGNFFSWISDTMFPTCPTVLIETGFISNPTECVALNDSEKQELLAKELTKGIIKFAKAQNEIDPNVVKPLAGDADGDGFVTTADAIKILRNIAGYDSTIIEYNADCDGSVGVTTADAIYILRKIAGY